MKTKIPKLVAALLFIGLVAWWIVLQAKYRSNTNDLLAFAGVYGAMALYGGILGVFISKKWGGLKSLLGRAIFVVALGLLAQEFGQLTYAYLTDIRHVDIPYPSVGDIGYFGSTLLYIYGIYLFFKAAGSHFSLKEAGSRVLALIIPVALLGISYYLFLRGYEFDWHHPLTIFLDFGYPFGEAIYISLAIMTFFLTRKYLGGIMRSRILLVIVAFVFQYASDFNFLYQNSHGTWVNGGYGDFLYFLAYSVMTAVMLYFASAYQALHLSSTGAVEPQPGEQA